MRIAHPPSIAANMDMFYIESDILAPTINSFRRLIDLWEESNIRICRP